MKRGDDQEIENTAASTDYGDYLSDSAPCYGESVERAVEDACDGQHHSTARATREQSPALDTFPDCISDEFGDDDSLLGEVMVGLADSQDIHASSRKEEEYRDPFDASDLDWNDDFSAELEKSAVNDGHPSLSAKANEKDTGQRGEASSSTVKAADLGAAANKSRHFAGLESGRKHSGFASAKTMVKDSVLRELRQPRASDLAGKLTGNSFIAAKTNERTNPVTIEDSVAPSDTDKQGPAEPDPKYKDLEPWLLAEFGGIVELVDE
jgi:ATP-dependent DNA helicase HFM1/MER3